MIREPEYGAGERAVPIQSPTDVKYIRITDFDDEGIVPGNVFVTAENIEDRYLLADSDILFARSGATAGKSFIYLQKTGPSIFAGYCIRFRFDKKRVLPHFIYFYTKTGRYEAWVRSIQRPSGQPNINKEEFKSFTVPLPPLDVQRALISEMEAARASRKAKLAEADALLAGLDDFLLDQLGLAPPQPDGRLAFAVRRENITGKRLDAPAYLPFFEKGKPPKTPTEALSEIAEIGPKRDVGTPDDEELVPYVGLPECDQTEIREVTMRPYSEVKGRRVFKSGDILFARIEPSVFNMKYVLADDLKGHDYAYTSTEFYVVRANSGVNVLYLYSMFFCSFVFAQVRGKTTGSSGRRRIDPDMFGNLQIPLPDPRTQDRIAKEYSHRRLVARHLREEAAREWEAAKVRFEAQLLGEEVKTCG